MPTTAPDDVSLSKAAIIERCIRRIREEYASDPSLVNFTHVDALTLNIERACQAAIDLAMHLIASQRLGIPRSSADAFKLVQRAGIIPEPLAQRLCAMTGFRNVAVHEYQEIDKDILHHIAKEGWKDLQEVIFLSTRKFLFFMVVGGIVSLMILIYNVLN